MSGEYGGQHILVKLQQFLPGTQRDIKSDIILMEYDAFPIS